MAKLTHKDIVEQIKAVSLNKGVEIKYSPATDMGPPGKRPYRISAEVFNVPLPEILSNADNAKEELASLLTAYGQPKMVLSFTQSLSRGWLDDSDEDGYRFVPAGASSEETGEIVSFVKGVIAETMREELGVDCSDAVIDHYIDIEFEDGEVPEFSPEELPSKRVGLDESDFPEFTRDLFTKVYISPEFALPESVLDRVLLELELEFGEFTMTMPDPSISMGGLGNEMTEKYREIVDGYKGALTHEQMLTKIRTELDNDGIRLSPDGLVRLERDLRVGGNLDVLDVVSKDRFRSTVEETQQAIALQKMEAPGVVERDERNTYRQQI